MIVLHVLPSQNLFDGFSPERGALLSATIARPGGIGAHGLSQLSPSTGEDIGRRVPARLGERFESAEPLPHGIAAQAGNARHCYACEGGPRLRRVGTAAASRRRPAPGRKMWITVCSAGFSPAAGRGGAASACIDTQQAHPCCHCRGSSGPPGGTLPSVPRKCIPPPEQMATLPSCEYASPRAVPKCDRESAPAAILRRRTRTPKATAASRGSATLLLPGCP